ncbi:MAG: iron ABC transporter permease [Sandaracinaceae bacterium]|nr:iron ABC transporter permease [Sandaracinaceae bacterium]
MRYLVLAAALAAVATLSLLVGPGDLGDAALRGTFLSLRAARVSGAMLAGGALGAAGALVQGLFRNPLASPSILGTTAGASFGGQVVLLAHASLASAGWLAWVAPEMVLPIGCLTGAFVSLAVLLAFVRRGADLLSLLLIGFALTSLFLALGSFLTTLAQERYELGRAVVAFTLGGLGGVDWTHVRLAIPLVAVAVVAGWLWGRPLDVLLAGEMEAASLGVDVPRTRRWTIAWVGVLTAAAVAIGGNIAFVGLVVPHALRPFFGAEHRRLIPAAVLGGATFLGACDLLARVLPTRVEAPLGVVTGLIGAPLFLLLLVRTRREGVA